MAYRRIGQGEQIYIVEKLVKHLNGQLEEIERIEAIRGGICYALSMEWLRRVIREDLSDELIHFNEVDFELVDVDDAELTEEQRNEQREQTVRFTYFKQIANSYFSFAHNWIATFGGQADARLVLEDVVGGRITNADQIDEVFAELFSRQGMSVVKHYEDHDIAALLDDFAGSGEDHPRYFLMTVAWSQGAHTMAGMMREDGSVAFYDPNAGVLEMDNIRDVISWFHDTGYPVNGGNVLYRISEMTGTGTSQPEELE